MLILAYDIGTTGLKSCLFDVDKGFELVASAQCGYGLTVLENGGVEQDVDEWWAAMCETTHALFAGDGGVMAVEGVRGEAHGVGVGEGVRAESLRVDRTPQGVTGVSPNVSPGSASGRVDFAKARPRLEDVQPHQRPRPEDVAGIALCSQMQGLVLVDNVGKALRPAMSYMDQRGTAEIRRGLAHGIQIAGANVFKLLKSLWITGAVASSVKDPVWKYKWVETCEPQIFTKVNKWLDVKEYLIARLTGEFVMTEDSAFATLLYDSRPGRGAWSTSICKMLGVRMEHLPRIIASTDRAGALTAGAASELGLAVGTPVFGGGGDASMIGVGAGCTKSGSTHIYSGTSGWVSTVVDKRMVDTDAMIAAIVGAERGKFNYFAEMETAGKCLEWAKDHLALDEIDIYLEKKHIVEAHAARACDGTYSTQGAQSTSTQDVQDVQSVVDEASQEAIYTSLYDYLTATIKKVPPGSGGVIFTPWLHGNRCPFEDPAAAGIFFNIKLETGKTELIRAMLEGVGFHLRWMLECQAKKLHLSDTLRFVGGGALSAVTCQILADITGKVVETVKNPQNVGSVGAAAVAAVGLGLLETLEQASEMIEVEHRFIPDPTNRAIYDKNYRVFSRLYKSNKKNFRLMNTAESKRDGGTA